MYWHTTLPVVTRFGWEATTHRDDDLLESEHPEVRSGVLAGKAFIFGGVTYTPEVELPQYSGRLRLTSLPEFPALPPGFLMDSTQRRLANTALEARARLDAARARVDFAAVVSVDAPHSEDISRRVVLQPTTSSPWPRRVGVLMLCVVLGAGSGLLAAQHRRLDDVAVRLSSWWRGGVESEKQRRDVGTATAASTTEWRDGEGGSGEEVGK